MKITQPPALPPESPRTLSESIRHGVIDYLAHLKLFSRNARLYLLGSFLMGINFTVFQLLLNLYLRDLGFAEGQIGWIVSSKAVGMTLIAIPAALLLSRIKLKPVLLIACVLFGIFSYFIVSYQALNLLIGFSLLSGMAFTFYRVAAAPFYMRNSTTDERTHLFSFSFGMMLLAGMVGSIGSGRMVTLIGEWTGDLILGYQYTLYFGIAVAMLSLIPFAFITASRPSKEEDRITLNLDQLKRRGGYYLKLFVTYFLVGAGAGLTIPFLNLYFRDRFGLEPDTIGVYYFVVQFAMLAGTLSGPVLAKKFGLVRTVAITQMASIPFMLILSYSYYLPLVFVAFVFRGGLMNLGMPIVTNFSMEISEKEEQGLVNALLMVGWTSSWMVSAAVGGSLIEAYGYTVTINTTILLYIISTAAFYGFFRKSERKTKGSSGWIIAREKLS